MKTGKWWTMAMALLCIILTSACGAKSEDTQLGNTKPEKKEQVLDIYVSDEQLMRVKSYKKKIQFTNDEEKYQAAVESLKSSDQDKDIPLWRDVEFKSLKMDNGTLVIDVHIPDKGNLGASGEQLALAALTQTLFQFSEVKAIAILVDGKKVESLMGHVELKHPIQRPWQKR